MKLVLTFGLLILAAIATAQEGPSPEYYVAQIRRYQAEPQQNLFVQIGGTIVTYRHVLTAAEPLRGVPHQELRVYFSSNQIHVTEDRRYVREVRFNHEQENQATLAIVVADFPIRDDMPIHPLDLGGLNLATPACQIYSFPGNAGNLVRSPITVRVNNCMQNFPWCGQITPIRQGVCTGFLGAPVICGNDAYISAISITSFACEAPIGTTAAPVVNLVNVADNAEWIASVTAEAYGSASSKVISVVAMIFGVALSKVL